MPDQLTLSFVAEMDRQAEEAKEVKDRRMKRANTIAIFKSIVRQHPMTEHERRVIPQGVRLARFVIRWECEKCPYACTDHSLGNKFGIDYTNPHGSTMTCVCLKDYYEKGYGGKTIAIYPQKREG